MGADPFVVTAKGKSAKEAFEMAVTRAQHAHGHGGYTGTIAEKHSFIEIALPAGQEAKVFANELIELGDARIEGKWGPAGCIDLGSGKFLFFGWAPS
jgi:hypothetical protein